MMDEQLPKKGVNPSRGWDAEEFFRENTQAEVWHVVLLHTSDFVSSFPRTAVLNRLILIKCRGVNEGGAGLAIATPPLFWQNRRRLLGSYWRP